MSKLKALIESKNKIAKEANAILDKSVEEVRALTEEENTDYEAKMAEVRSLEKTIELLEKRAEEDAQVEVEERKEEQPMEEKREITLEEEQANEIRAIEDFIKGKITDEVRAMSTSTNGGITIPTHLYNDIIKKLYEVAPLFAKARRFTPVSGVLEILKEGTLGNAAFVGEMENITATDFTFEKVKLEQRRCGSAIELSQQLVNDSGIDIVSYAKDTLIKRLGLMLDRNVVNGTKATQFEGLLSAPETCKVKAETAVPVNDDYRDVVNSMPLELVGGAEWIMSRKEFNRVSKLKDALGHYYMVTDVINGRPVYKYHGLPINITDAMPELNGTEDQVAAILVNMPEAYATMVKKGFEMKHITGDTTQALRGSHLLLLDIYADGKIINEQAIKLLVTGPAE